MAIRNNFDENLVLKSERHLVDGLARTGNMNGEDGDFRGFGIDSQDKKDVLDRTKRQFWRLYIIAAAAMVRATLWGPI